MALDTTKTLTGVTYNGVAFPLDDGKDMLQARVDAINSCAYLFYNYGGTELDITRLDTSNVTTMNGMFYGCTKLIELDISSFDTSNVTNMGAMFYDCSALPTLDVSNFDTSNVTTMRSMFSNCNKVTTLDVSNFNTSKVTDMGYIFHQCNKLTSLDLSNFNTSNVTNMDYMFYYCNWLTSLNMGNNFNTSNVTNMNSMFNRCIGITTLNLSNFNTSNVTNMGFMFASCQRLTALDLSNFDTSKVTNIQSMFAGCDVLTTVQGTLDLYSTTNPGNMFNYTYALTGVTLKNIRRSLQIGSGTEYGHLWELPYLINAVKECWDLSASTQQTLTIGSANVEKIANVYVRLITPTAEQIEADPYINNKLPCEVCESTDEGAMTLTAYAGLKNWVLA